MDNTNDPCVYCGEPTAFGSGRFVNRIPADTYDDETGEYRDGFACAECLAFDCNDCDQPIPLDEDIYVEIDGFGMRLCEACVIKRGLDPDEITL